jgi:lysyl-tRNA synthetase class 2
VYVLGQRVHEVALGIAVLALVGAGLALHLFHSPLTVAIVGGIGVWLVAKDWRDLFPRWRNTQTHRRFGVHLPEGTRLRRGIDLPTVAALATLAVAAVNAASALTPNVAWRGHVLLHVEPVAALPVFHAVALPASVGLGLTAVYLRRRRRRALLLAIGLLLVLGVADELKGLDFEEAALSGGLAALLWYGRSAFHVEHERLRLRAAALPLAVVGTTLGVAGAISVWLAGATDPSVHLAADEAGALLAWQSGPIPLDDPVVGYVVRGLAAAALVVAAWVIFRPRRPERLTGSAERDRACELVRAHGRDTLAAFKLRRDLDYLFEPGGRAFVGYRVERGVLLVAGDPVGPDEAIPAVIDEVCSFAEAHGLRVGGVGASEAVARQWRDAGLRALYIGDEAIVDTRTFSLDGRPVRKVRQSVTRLVSAGFTASVDPVATLDETTVAELEAVSARWRGDEPERGFAMSIAGLGDGPPGDGVVVIARDGEGAARGWLHFLPTYGRPAMSLALMRRDRDTPNGLMEFLVVRSLELLRDRGIDEVSLNFAAFARPLRSPRGPLDRLARSLLRVASRWFQIESLYRFNAKFFPRWEPRYLLYSRSTALPAIGLAALAVEGQLPRPVTALLRAGAPA